MKNLKLSISLLILVAFTFAGFKAINTKLQLKWTNDAGFKIPESVCYDAERKVLYVSNINGKPSEKDGNGYISKIDLNGKTIKSEWVTALNAPKGMGIIGNKLYVTDIDRISEIDIEKGEIIKFYEFPEAEFLNDIATGINGAVWATCSSTGNIFLIFGGEASKYPCEKFNRPNGIFHEQGYIFIGTSDGIYKYDLESGVSELIFKNTGSIDGLKRFGYEGFIFSDWSGRVFSVNDKGEKVKLLDTTPEKINAADFEYIPELNLIVIPTFLHNSVMAYELK
ncbi:MAG: hypothetical protein K9J13_14195 [Saprospiraceae bacterium]|nr:hypothetical protein [Saprospiraceae bacterium]